MCPITVAVIIQQETVKHYSLCVSDECVIRKSYINIVARNHEHSVWISAIDTGQKVETLKIHLQNNYAVIDGSSLVLT